MKKYLVLTLFLCFSYNTPAEISNIKKISTPLISQMRGYIRQNLDIDTGDVPIKEVAAEQMCDKTETIHGCASMPARYDSKHKTIIINKDFMGSLNDIASDQQRQQMLQYAIIHELAHHVLYMFIDADSLDFSAKTYNKNIALKKQILTEGYAEYLTENFLKSHQYNLNYIEDDKISGIYSLPYSYGEKFFFNHFGNDIKSAINGIKKLLSDKVSIYEIIGKDKHFSKTATSLIDIKDLSINNGSCKVKKNNPMTAADLFQFLEYNLLNRNNSLVIYRNILSAFQIEIECEESKIAYFTFEFSDNIALNWDNLLFSNILAETQNLKYATAKGLKSAKTAIADKIFSKDQIGYFYNPLAFYMLSKLYPEEFPVPLRYQTVIGFKHKNLLFLAIGYGEQFNKPFCQPNIIKKHKELARICAALP